MYKSSILIGNGINRSFDKGSISLDNLLKQSSKGNQMISESDDIPFTLKIVLGTNNDVHNAMKKSATEIWGCLTQKKQAEYYGKLISLPVEDILTVNYGFELEEAANHIIGERISSSRVNSISDYIRGIGITRKEANIFLHTFQKISNDGMDKRIWHIHGHCKNSSSMVIGHYYYGNLLFKIKSYLQKSGARYKWSEVNNKEASIRSWVDAFIMNDIYVLGFGYDFAEMDLWWLLERKNREKASHGKLFFYEPQTDNADRKHDLLRCYGAEVRTLGYRIDSNDSEKSQLYEKFYYDAVDDIQKSIERSITDQ